MLLPSVREIVDRELKEASVKITKQIHRCDDKRIFVKELPRNGMSNKVIIGLAGKRYKFIVALASSIIEIQIASLVVGLAKKAVLFIHLC